MTSLGDYPLGAKYDSKAPYNSVENPEIEVELDVWVTLHKTIKVKTSDYQMVDEGSDELGYYCEIDYSNCDFTSDIEGEIEDSLPTSSWEIDEYDYSVIND